jgi:hypothetical protein
MCHSVPFFANLTKYEFGSCFWSKQKLIAKILHNIKVTLP